MGPPFVNIFQLGNILIECQFVALWLLSFKTLAGKPSIPRVLLLFMFLIELTIL